MKNDGFPIINSDGENVENLPLVAYEKLARGGFYTSKKCGGYANMNDMLRMDKQAAIREEFTVRTWREAVDSGLIFRENPDVLYPQI